jgi:ferrous iron transport protein B
MTEGRKKFTIALAGNPNCGKTTLFNALTGSSQRVGNWPGVTVERMEGKYTHNGVTFEVIDLPGIYSFSAYSLDEKVSREFILHEKPDLVVDIIDASNLERNLYLTTQLIEMKVPIVAVLNMMDIVKQHRIGIEIDHLAQHLDSPVIPLTANKKTGIGELKDLIAKSVKSPHRSSVKVEYDEIVENAVSKLEKKVVKIAEKESVDSRWLAIKLIENDELAVKMTNGDFEKDVDNFSAKIAKHTGDSADIVVADGRYGFIHGLARDVINRDAELTKTVTDTIDRFVLNRFVGIPLFLLIMFIMFSITMNFGAPFIDFFDILCGTIFVDGTRTLLQGSIPEWAVSLLADGLGGGIQTVATFIPPITLIFLSLSVLEDSGYMSRASFIMDRFMRRIGLPGKAFIPMLVGFGCNVPGILATRTLESRRDRILSIMINPFISCGARLPVYALFTAAFFREQAAVILFGLYLTGIIAAVLTALLFGRTILKGEASIFVMELPPYHIPTVNGIIFHTWNRLKSFIVKAGQAIIIIVIVMSLLKSIGTDGSFGNQNSDKSLLVVIGKKLTPVFTPMGISSDNWPATVALFTGIFAKEAVVGTINSLYLDSNVRTSQTNTPGNPVAPPSPPPAFWTGIADAFKAVSSGFKAIFVDTSSASATEDSNLTRSLKQHFKSSAAVLAYLLFVLLYCPCLATIAVIYSETNIKWAAFSVTYLTTVAWITATIFYQISQLTVNPKNGMIWIGICLAIITIFITVLKKIPKGKENV